MSQSNLPAHSANVFILSCMDDRLVPADARKVESYGGGFEVRVAGGPLAILNPNHRQAILDQFSIAQLVDGHNLIILRAHVGCGYATLNKDILNCDGDSSVDVLFERLGTVAGLVKDALHEALGDDAGKITIKLEVVEPTAEGKVLKEAELHPVR